MENYNDFQKNIALAYAHAKFADYLQSVAEEQKTRGKDMKTFSEFLEVGLELSVSFAENHSDNH